MLYAQNVTVTKKKKNADRVLYLARSVVLELELLCTTESEFFQTLRREIRNMVMQPGTLTEVAVMGLNWLQVSQSVKQPSASACEHHLPHSNAQCLSIGQIPIFNITLY